MTGLIPSSTGSALDHAPFSSREARRSPPKSRFQTATPLPIASSATRTQQTLG
jgi:hypothetical protein